LDKLDDERGLLAFLFLKPGGCGSDYLAVAGLRMAPADEDCLVSDGPQGIENGFILFLNLLPQPATIMGQSGSVLATEILAFVRIGQG
jgi:hypothetical protein